MIPILVENFGIERNRGGRGCGPHTNDVPAERGGVALSVCVEDPADPPASAVEQGGVQVEVEVGVPPGQHGAELIVDLGLAVVVVVA